MKFFKKGNVKIKINRDSQTISEPKITYKAWYHQKVRHLSAGLHYKYSVKLVLGVLILTHFGFYLTALGLVLQDDVMDFVIIGYIFRSSIFIWIFKKIGNQLQENFPWYLLLILDFIYIFNYILLSLNTIFAKKIKWT